MARDPLRLPLQVGVSCLWSVARSSLFLVPAKETATERTPAKGGRADDSSGPRAPDRAIALAPDLDLPVGAWLDTDLHGWTSSPRVGPWWIRDDEGTGGEVTLDITGINA